MELPPSVFIALGVIIAALITGSIALVNLIIAKDQKTSEFRQEWINRLRDDVATLVGYIRKHSAYVNIRGPKLDDPQTYDETLDDIIENVKPELDRCIQIIARIMLYLNPKDDSAIIEKVKEMEDLYDNIANRLRDVDKVGDLTDELVALTQTLLKTEWKRVKRGEPSFFLTKYVALAVIISVLFLGFSYKKELAVTMDDIFQSTDLGQMED